MTPNENPPTLVKCPVCDGQGTVSRPPWVAGDQPTWIDTQTAPYPCKACHGKGAVLIYTQEFATYGL